LWLFAYSNISSVEIVEIFSLISIT
jgi:hypothetical protein